MFPEKPEFQLLATYVTVQAEVGGFVGVTVGVGVGVGETVGVTVGVGVGVVPAAVVTDSALEALDTLPAASLALTVNEYVVEAVRPVAVKLVEVGDPMSVVPRYTSYPVTPTASVEAVQVSGTVVDVTVPAVRAVGAVGAMVSVGVVPPVITGYAFVTSWVNWASNH
jgi:hypothetical protein